MRPGVNVVVTTAPPTRSAPIDTGVWFVAGITEKGPADRPLLIRSMADYSTILGSRVTYGVLYDALDLFFREGGSQAYVLRVVGPTSVKAQKIFNDVGAAATLTVRAQGPGDYANTQLKVGILTGLVSGFRIQVLDGSNVVLELSPDLATKADAFTWAQASQYIELVDGASQLNPAPVAAAALTGGTDDRNNIVEANWKTAIDRAAPGYGPGQVSYPGRTTAQAYLDLLSHAAANNRTAILDAADTPTAATLIAAASAARAGNQHFGGLFAPWLVVPGVTSGSTRTLPPSGLVAGRINAADQAFGPNTPAAGDLGQSVYAQTLSQLYDDVSHESLNNAGVNVIRIRNGIVTVYGWRSLANPASEATWLPLGHQRIVMAVVARSVAVFDRFMFKPIDGQGKLQARLASSLVGEIVPFYDRGELYGASPERAFRVDTGNTINTTVTLANNELRALIQLRPSPFAEMATITIVKTQVTEEVV